MILIEYYRSDNYGIMFEKIRDGSHEAMHVIAEPGDATHYEIFSIPYDGTNSVIAVPMKNWSIVWDISCSIHTTDLPFDNAYTRAVYADIISGKPGYYDWVKRRPNENT